MARTGTRMLALALAAALLLSGCSGQIHIDFTVTPQAGAATPETASLPLPGVGQEMDLHITLTPSQTQPDQDVSAQVEVTADAPAPEQAATPETARPDTDGLESIRTPEAAAWPVTTATPEDASAAENAAALGADAAPENAAPENAATAESAAAAGTATPESAAAARSAFLGGLYADDAAWQLDCERAQALIDGMSAYQGLLNTASGIRNALLYADCGELAALRVRLRAYAQLRDALEPGAGLLAQMQRLDDAWARQRAALAQEIAALPLATRQVIFDDPLFEGWERRVAPFLDPDHTAPGLEAAALQTSRRRLQAVYETARADGKAGRAVLAGLLAASAADNRAIAGSVGYSSTLDWLLAGEGLDAACNERLIQATHSALPALRRYRQARMGSAVPAVPYEQAAGALRTALEPLGDDYLAQYDALLDGGEMLVRPATAESAAAVTAGDRELPPRLLLDYAADGRGGDVLAGAVGVAICDAFAAAEPTGLYGAADRFTQDLAACVNELLLAERRLQTARTDAARLTALEQLLDLYDTAFFAPVREAEFAAALYAAVESGEEVTAEALDARWRALGRQYDGAAAPNTPDWSDCAALYGDGLPGRPAFAFLCAATLCQRLTGDDAEKAQQAADQYLALLKRGANAAPAEALLGADIDLRDAALYRTVLDRYEDLAAEYEALTDGD